ncbi:hypothetical protein C8J56DRAFT_1115054 [Mycena floridula]|nr:hypothetical protein C8J56DRAFT_1115054 [Mycena floridula]
MAYVTEHADELGQDCLLSLTKLDFSGTRASTVSRFQKYLHESRVKFATRSAFVANSGHTDDFAAIEELTRTARNGLHLNGHVVPSFAHLTEAGEGEGHALNAYLFDFYVHGQVASLTNANGIRRGDLWYLLDDFNLTLAAIKAALEGLLQNSGTADVMVSGVKATRTSQERDLESSFLSADRLR